MTKNPTYLEIDAHEVGLGAVLLQVIEEMGCVRRTAPDI